MSLLSRILNDPPPAFAFEISSGGVAFARTSAPAEMKFEALPEGSLEITPLHDNVQNPDALADAVARLVGSSSSRKRRAALILPDYAARVAVLDFDNFPDDSEEQLSLIRFRIRKSVPFDVDSAVTSYHAQPRHKNTGGIDVVVAVMAREIVSRYEEALRGVGLQPGYVVTSTLAALNLLSPADITVFARLSGRALSVVVLDGPLLKLARCIELDDIGPADIMSVLHPTMVFIEDELGSRAQRIVTCGFGTALDDLASEWQREWGVAVEPLRSGLGTPQQNNAGLIGYLEGAAA